MSEGGRCDGAARWLEVWAASFLRSYQLYIKVILGTAGATCDLGQVTPSAKWEDPQPSIAHGGVKLRSKQGQTCRCQWLCALRRVSEGILALRPLRVPRGSRQTTGRQNAALHYSAKFRGFILGSSLVFQGKTFLAFFFFFNFLSFPLSLLFLKRYMPN